MKRNDKGYDRQHEPVDPKQMIALEEELIQLKKEYGIKEKDIWWRKLGDVIAERIDGSRPTICRKRYIKLALSCGWICGAHRFYAGQQFAGILYLLFCWTGIPFAMTLVDLMIVIPIQPDETGMIQV